MVDDDKRAFLGERWTSYRYIAVTVHGIFCHHVGKKLYKFQFDARSSHRLTLFPKTLDSHVIIYGLLIHALSLRVEDVEGCLGS